jgi:hypothetical protein
MTREANALGKAQGYADAGPVIWTVELPTEYML